MVWQKKVGIILDLPTKQEQNISGTRQQVRHVSMQLFPDPQDNS